MAERAQRAGVVGSRRYIKDEWSGECAQANQTDAWCCHEWLELQDRSREAEGADR